MGKVWQKRGNFTPVMCSILTDKRDAVGVIKPGLS